MRQRARTTSTLEGGRDDRRVQSPVAFVGLVALVAARVRLQVGQLAEGLLAADRLALVRLLAGVRAQVLLQVRQLCELRVRMRNVGAHLYANSV